MRQKHCAAHEGTHTPKCTAMAKIKSKIRAIEHIFDLFTELRDTERDTERERGGKQKYYTSE